MRAIAEAGTEGSAKIRQLWKESFLLFFGIDQKLAEVGWDCFMEQGVPRFFESWAGTVTYPMQV